MPLPDNISLGYVNLRVPDLSRSTLFYENILGLKVSRQDGDTVYLGAGENDLVALTEHPGASYYPRRSGLYHFALLVPSRRDLGDFLRNLVENKTPLQGFADHLVSEAIYLSDPDGNGIEVYRDRPRTDWEYRDGKIKMATDPFDFDGVIAQSQVGADWHGLPGGTTLGHMHLHVGDLQSASAFYQDLVGFDLINADYPGARFLSAGGYHHHLGINTWNGVGAPPAPEDAVGLRYFSVVLPGEEPLAALRARLNLAGTQFKEREGGFLANDPSGNGIKFTCQRDQRSV